MREKKKIILVPYPAQGHVTPMLKLAGVLANVGRFQPVVLTPEFIHRRISPRIDGVVCLALPDGLEDGAPCDFFGIERAMEEKMPPVLEGLLREMAVACVVVDLLASWAVEVARRCGVEAVGFWPAMHATYRLLAAIPHLIRTGLISKNGCPRNPNDPIWLSSDDEPEPPPTLLLTTSELPWLIGSSTARIARFKFWTRTLQRSKCLKYLLINTFPQESKLLMPQQSSYSYSYSYSYSTKTKSKVVMDCPRILEMGPLIMQAATTGSSSSLWEEDMSCLEWLDHQNVGSVLYISFGSWVSPIGEVKVKALASTLAALGRPFIWVLASAWRRGLPDADAYMKRVAAHGRIVQWAPQLEVLQHPSVGCYLSHCGWNSTMEAIQCKKPLLCYPIAGDQLLNSLYIVNTWKIGIKIQTFRIEEIRNGISKILEDQNFRATIEDLNEKLFGTEGTSKAIANLSTFMTHLNP